MVKSYLRYLPEASYGILCSPNYSNGALLLSTDLNNPRKYGITISGEIILILDLEKGIIYKKLKLDIGDNIYSVEGISSTIHYVTSLCRHPTKSDIIAAGYSDGSVRIWNIEQGDIIHIFHGHKKSISVLRFCKIGHYLATGSYDTDIIIWDILSGTGLHRYIGHINEITDIQFLHKIKLWDSYEENNNIVKLEETPHILISSSKDGTVKLWDITGEFCLQTLTQHKGEINSILVHPLCNRIIVAGTSQNITLYRLNSNVTGIPKEKLLPNDRVTKVDNNKDSDDMNNTSIFAEYHGSIPRITTGNNTKITKLAAKWFNYAENSLDLTDDYSGLIFAFSSKNSIETFGYLGYSRITQRIKKFLKRKSKKDPDLGKLDDINNNELLFGNYEILTFPKMLLLPEEEIIGTRLISIDYQSWNNSFLTCLANNTIKYIQIEESVINNWRSKLDKSKGNDNEYGDIEDSNICCNILRRIEIEGHRGIPRALEISLDDKFIVSFGDDSIKVWNMATFSCVRSIMAESPVCGFIVPGNEYTVSGTKSASIQLHSLLNCSLEQSLDNAHEGSIQAIALHPNKVTFASVGQDKKLNIYNLKMKDSGIKGQYSLFFKLQNSIPLIDEGLTISYTSDSRYLIVSLLDNTLQVLYTDTYKQFLVLYGHKLPVPCMDVSSDSTILVTGSADKTIKIWGLDFGNIQRSFFAHEECITQVKFIYDTHYVVSTARDGSLKIWDIDTGDLITVLHKKSTYGLVPIVSLALSLDGDRIICGNLDRSMRIWRRSERQLFLQEEREKDMEEQFQQEILRDDILNEISNPAVFMMRPTRKTIESIQSTEKLMEIIDIAYNYYVDLCKWIKAEKEANEDSLKKVHITPPKCPLEIKDKNLYEYIYKSIQCISSNYLTEVIWSLPLLYAEKLLILIEQVLKSIYDQYISYGMNNSAVKLQSENNKDIENIEQEFLCINIEPLVRVVLYLVQTHFVHWISLMNSITPQIAPEGEDYNYGNWSNVNDPRLIRTLNYNIRAVLSNLNKYLHILIHYQINVASLNNSVLKVLEKESLNGKISDLITESNSKRKSIPKNKPSKRNKT
ncbi:uncharacterized protein CMU_025380 [Cryptosporidium muris RN66]|uniref:WD domain, G-beta repeat-containing protein n=1 Tax=Cryptosporidium muris (strain RN66) TaxID=441375 RepID=B6AAY0_CRYMR|nr:uncharacterized protein CMU_025380 [Cryptosporidium muris RN66]EEA05532.1 hypothetical protein, conserved [Cryptosporidium muris RN66]|eukprot:XP_002139881.1 hypothetical protein [Cryptosporidium muris RN66]